MAARSVLLSVVLKHAMYRQMLQILVNCNVKSCAAHICKLLNIWPLLSVFVSDYI